MKKLVILWASAAVLGAAAAPLDAGPSEAVACADEALSVDASLPEVAALACGYAIQAKARLVACGLRQTRPVEIFLVDRFDEGIENCLAYYDCTDGAVRVTDPAALEARLPDDHPYRVLPTEVVLQALISHELAHALLDQTRRGADGREPAFVDQEYVAAAMELDLLDERWRTALIDAAPVSLPPREGLISALIYAFEPRKFATNAWQFFAAEPDGCARVRRIAEGTFSFADQPR